VRLIIYSKPGCHLCDEMKALVYRTIADQSDISLDDVDISRDPELMDRYSLDIPVLMIDGKKVAKYRVSDEELRRMISSRRS
jgi:glutaredoxin